MQHLDEGTIHSWLDGALSADEAARVEAHVAECPQCAAAVAEARGFIAASSRILTALDHVPRGVVPAAAPVKWYNRAAWRAAAAVLVVAVGSLVVVTNGERNKVAAPAASPRPTASKLQAPPTAMPVGQRAATASSITPTAEADFSGKQVGRVAQGSAVTRQQARVGNLDAAIGVNTVAAPQAAGAATTTVQSKLSGRVSGVVVADSTAPEPAPLRAVGHPRLIGAKVTLYEVAPGDTVTFTELSNVQLESVVTTGLSRTEPQARRSVEKSAATATAPVQVAAPSPPIISLQVSAVNGLTTISWLEVPTGNMLKLSGRMSVERLKEIKLRIERERAAEAAKKKP
jgi:anti-sigma factor RsiW